ncbi:hypothetical protein SY2F82_72230 [Streptomyces sp. Y2F8-2]|uniref:hypothetical protein n=1 Tax=Streptomyces sp. Y2F8-2 TaxID=2759675 RepID=UPI0019047950|nr:hypothetical protein [Streptomyces sp. Y2F8-2]GHK05426.1 hypothetical protein SY2F82_72230 [Streptomyces sp. Y2F8-2]
MAIIMPTADDAQALYDFIMERANEEWAAINGDDTLDPDAAARFYRISNSNKLGLAGLTAYIVDLLKRGDDNEQAALAWDHLTAAGEEWREHPDYLPRWENAKRAEIRRQLAG